MPTTSATFTNLYAPGLRKIIFESYDYLQSQYTGWLRTASSDRQYEDDYRMAGFGTVPIKPEGAGIIYDDPVPDTTVRYTWSAFGKGYRVTHEAQADDLYGPMQRMAGALGRAFRRQEETQGAGLLNNAFTAAGAGSNNAGFDPAIALCGVHTLVRIGGTFRNAPSANVDLSVTALQNSLVDFDRWVDESGNYIVLPARKLLISPEDLPLAREILGSQFKPFTSDNEINVLSNSLDIVLSHFKTDQDSWFVLADPADTDLWFTWREKFSTDASDDFDSGDGKIKGYMRFGTGYGDYRGIWGSEGV